MAKDLSRNYIYRHFTIIALAVGCARSGITSEFAIEGNAPLALAQPAAVNAQHIEPIPAPVDAAQVESIPFTSGLSLATVEDLALANNPAIAREQANIRALQGKWVQVGLPPNPTAGYSAAEVGSGGTAGQQGGFAGQVFVTAHKLKRNREIVCAEIRTAEQQLAAISRRVRTDARVRYYNTLLAQQRVQLAGNLVELAGKATDTSKSLVDAQEIPLAGLLQTEVSLQNAQLLLRTSNNSLDQAWRQLQTLMGDANLARQLLTADIHALPADLDFESQLTYVQAASPELATAMANVERTRRVLDRQSVQAVPNVNTQVSVQYDNSSGDTLTGVQVGIALPIWNRNQGGIAQARAQITQAAREVERVERNLERRMADAFRQYADARMTVETYADEILPRSQRTLDLVQQGYAQGEVGYLDLLTAQRTFFQTSLAYLDALGNLWQSYLRIDGLLLEGSLEQPTQ